jgi:hypothetical protein
VKECWKAHKKNISGVKTSLKLTLNWRSNVRNFAKNTLKRFKRQKLPRPPNKFSEHAKVIHKGHVKPISRQLHSARYPVSNISSHLAVDGSDISNVWAKLSQKKSDFVDHVKKRKFKSPVTFQMNKNLVNKLSIPENNK